MARFHFYFQTFSNPTTYTGTWIEVTEDAQVAGLGKLKHSLDNSEYNVGVFRNSNISISLRNDHGRYSDVDTLQSIFNYKRPDTKVKITWEPGDTTLVCGFFQPLPGRTIITEEVEVFQGLLKDDATTEGITTQAIKFSILGYESIFSQATVPFSLLSDGDTFEEILLTILDQTLITNLLTVSSANLNTGTNSVSDSVAELENKTVLDALKQILLPSNSVLYINADQEVIVSERTVNATLKHTFYGDAATGGIENIIDIKNFRLGVHRVFNFWTWKDVPARLQNDSTSIGIDGTRKKEIDTDIITVEAKQNAILTSLLTEFGSRKIELDITAPFDINTYDIFLLDKISIDFPSLALNADGRTVAVYNIGDYGIDYYANEIYNLTIGPTVEWKVMERSIDFNNQLLTLKLREV